MNGMIPRQDNLENKIRKWQGVDDVAFTDSDTVLVTLNDWSMKPIIYLWLVTLFDKRGLKFDDISFVLDNSSVKRLPAMRRLR